METCTSLCGQLQHPNLVVSELDGDDFVRQAFQFLLAGFERSGNTISYALYEFALHPEIQKRLRAEIMQVLNKHNGQLINDGIQEMAHRRWPIWTWLCHVGGLRNFTLDLLNMRREKLYVHLCANFAVLGPVVDNIDFYIRLN